MDKRIRTILFIACVLLFTIVAPSIILYSQGYRFDFETNRVVQTGGLYFRVSPRNADVYINEKLKSKTSIFTNSSMIENLLPKRYSVEIKKEGYHSWQKNLDVKEKQVTDAKNIVLFPKSPDFILISTSTYEINNIVLGIEASATSSDKNKLIELSEHEIWISFLKVQQERLLEGFKEKIFLTRFSEKIDKVFWLTNYYLIFNTGDKIKIAEIDDRDKLNVIDLAEFEAPEIFWNKENKNLYILTGKNLYLLDSLLP